MEKGKKMRLIDADKLVNRIVFHTNLPTEIKEEMEDEIEDAPTIDAVEVVRCKDCKEYKYCYLLPNDDDYCSKGERRGEWQED